jgi:hypothetical protein
MRWNASYRYRNQSTNNQFEAGGVCQVDNASMAQLRETDWGNEKVFVYDVYMRNSRPVSLSVADVVEITMYNGEQFIATVKGIDFADKLVFALSVESVTASVVANGSVSFKSKTGGGIDSTTGYPKPTVVTWNTAVLCRYTTLTLNLQAKSEQEAYIEAKYAIYLQGKTMPTEQIKLNDSDGNTLGEFSIISYEYLDTKNITKIIV